MPERRTPLYDIHVRSAARMVKGGGDFMYPLSYSSPMEEHINARTNVGMQDLSTMGEVDIKGPGAERLVNHLLVNDVRDMYPGQVRYSTMCREDGGIVDDVTVYKFNDEHFMIVTSSGPRKKTARWIADHAVGTSTYVTDITAAIALPVVQGPRSRDFLQSVMDSAGGYPRGEPAQGTGAPAGTHQSGKQARYPGTVPAGDLDELRYFWFMRGRINETDLLISRTGYTGELGYELYTPAEEAAVLWEYLMQAGQEFGLMPYGVQAMQSLRIEKAFPLYGPDISEDYTPFHLGLDRWIAFGKRAFVGREALLRAQARGVEQRWAGLVLDGHKPASTGDRVYSIGDVVGFEEQILTGSEAGDYEDREIAGEDVGHVTSSAQGYTVGKVLALAFVDVQHAWPGARLLVDVDGRLTPATAMRTPFFDPGFARAKAGS
jgi:aminomethyltransferase